MKQINQILSDLQQLAQLEQWHAIDKDLALQHIRSLYTAVLNMDVTAHDATLTAHATTSEHIQPIAKQSAAYTGQGYYNGFNNFSTITINEDDFKRIPLVNAVTANDLAEEQPIDEIELITPHNLAGLSDEISSAFELTAKDLAEETILDSVTFSEQPQEELLTIQEIEAAFNQEIHHANTSPISIELPEMKVTAPIAPIVNNDAASIALNEDDDAFYDKLKHLSKPKLKPTAGQGFIAPMHTKQKDIRNAIGLNDKYLFLNELFNNDKDAYDGAISQINNMEQYEDAKLWVDQNLLKEMKWDMNDNTVATFYGLLEKHFNLI